jgi:hypothetical protein
MGWIESMRRPIVIARKTFSAFHLALSAFFVLSLFGSPAYGQRKDKNETIEHPNGLVQDWSHHHAVYPRVGPIQSLIAVQNSPRAIQNWQAAARANWHRTNNPKSHNGKQAAFHRDWSISLGTGTTAPGMYPAKFGFNPNATITVADCLTDFIVYPVNVVGSAGQPNIVGFNNLYSGTVGSTGLCNAPANGRTTVGGNDDGFSATTMWSYNVHAAGGKVATSPVLSIDGTKVAFVETKSIGAAHFHVLAWKSKDGVPGNLQTVTPPVTIDSLTPFSTTQPAAGSGAATDLELTDGSLGTTSDDTLSSPFFDYARDLAYVGDDNGILFRIKNVFCLFPSCTSALPVPEPSLDATWGTTGAVNTGCTGKLTGPVVDESTLNVFVGCSDGKLYGFTSAGVALTPTATLTVGDGTATGGIVDPPIVDGVNGLIYAVSGSSGGASILVQAKTDLTSKVTVTLGAGGTFDLHAPAFNDAYFSSTTSSDWVLYSLAQNGTSSVLYGVGFNSARVLNSTAVPNTLGIGPLEFSPLTEFASGGQDRLFESDQSNNSNNTVSFRVDGVTTASFPPALQSFITEGNGTTGIVIDNDASGTNQANSLYFGVLGSNTAVKLTQGAFQ